MLECTHCIMSDRSCKKKSQIQQAANDRLHGYEELVAAIINAHHEGKY